MRRRSRNSREIHMKTKQADCRRIQSGRRDGGTLLLVVFFMVALFGFAAMSIDVGNVLVQRERIQESGDSSALAAVVDWATSKVALTADQRARSYAQANGLQASEVESVVVGKWDSATKTFTAKDPLVASEIPAVQITNKRVVPMAFAKVVGLSSMSPRTVSIAVAALATAAGRTLPWAACNNPDNPIPDKCVIINLKNENDCTGPGNFGALALGGTGASNYKDNIVDGYDGVLRIGDIVYTEPGKMVGPTDTGLQDRLQGLPPYVCTPTSLPPDNKRTAVIPVTTDFGCGGRCGVKILDFYVVALINIPGSGEVVAQFLEVYNGTEVDPTKPPEIGKLNGITLVK